jgi:hypothetical protein
MAQRMLIALVVLLLAVVSYLATQTVFGPY